MYSLNYFDTQGPQLRFHYTEIDGKRKDFVGITDITWKGSSNSGTWIARSNRGNGLLSGNDQNTDPAFDTCVTVLYLSNKVGLHLWFAGGEEYASVKDAGTTITDY